MVDGAEEPFFTNASRKVRKGMGTNSSCVVCRNGVEDLLHLLHDFRRAKGIWISSGALDMDANCFGHDWISWITFNLTCQSFEN